MLARCSPTILGVPKHCAKSMPWAATFPLCQLLILHCGHMPTGFHWQLLQEPMPFENLANLQRKLQLHWLGHQFLDYYVMLNKWRSAIHYRDRSCGCSCDLWGDWSRRLTMTCSQQELLLPCNLGTVTFDSNFLSNWLLWGDQERSLNKT